MCRVIRSDIRASTSGVPNLAFTMKKELGMDRTEHRLALSLRSYWTPGTVLTAAFLVFTLGLSGLRIREALATRDSSSPAVATALALGIEGAAGLAAYRVLQLRRREQPLSGYLVGGLCFFVVLSAAAHLDHALRYTQPAFANPAWLAFAWEVVLNLLLALAYPSGLLLVGEVLPEHLRAIDSDNAARRKTYEEERAAARQREHDLWAAQRASEQPQPRESPPMQATAAEPAPAAVPAPLPPPDERVGGWEKVWDLANGKAFDLPLVQQVFSATAIPYLEEAVTRGLLQQDGRGRYCFTVQVREGIPSLLAPKRG